MLDAEEVRTFVNGTVHFFETATGHAATVGSPYLCIDKAAVVQDYTGVIGITGNREGKVYFTAPRGMLTVLLMKMNESNVTHDNLCDLVGEVANTISGNVRRDCGKEFVISVPTILTGIAAPIELPAGCRPVVIPINWRSHAAKLVVCLQ